MGPNSGISLVLVQNMLTRIHIYIYIYIWRYENMILVVNRIHSSVYRLGFRGSPHLMLLAENQGMIAIISYNGVS